MTARRSVFFHRDRFARPALMRPPLMSRGKDDAVTTLQSA
jgi:hypothetical protein